MAVDPAADIVHAVKAAKEERLGRPGEGLGFGLLWSDPTSGLAERALPPIAFNYLGAGARTSAQQADTSLPFMVDAGAPPLPATVSGRMAATNPLTINVSTRSGVNGRELYAELLFAEAALDEESVHDLVARWSSELTAVVAELEVSSPGLSPSDVPGTGITQRDLDLLAVRYPEADVWPLTALQNGLYIESALAGTGADDGVDVYVSQAILRIGGSLDEDRFRWALQQLLARHRVLRSAYVATESGATVAVVPPTAAVPWRTVDLGDVDEAGRVAAVAEIKERERIERFDMTVPALLRVVAVNDRDGATLIITNHHILFDGWSGPLVLADVLALYASGVAYTAGVSGGVSGDFGDFVRGVGGSDRAAGLAAWGEVLGVVEGPTLVAPGVGASVELLPRDRSVVLDAGLVSGVEGLARSQGVTVAMVLQCAWAVLLSRLTGNRVVAFGETTSGRPADLEGVESMVGLFINTVPAVVDVDPGLSVAEVLRRVQASKVAVLDHLHVGLPELSALAGVGQLFDTLTVHESYPVDSESLSTADAAVTGGLSIGSIEVSDSTQYPLNMITSPSGDSLTVKIEYLPAAFADEQIDVIIESLVQILGRMASDPDTLTADLPLLSADAAEAMVVRSTGASVVVGEETVADAVMAGLVAAGDRGVVVCGDRVVSGREFAARVSVLARELVGLGVGPEVAVGVSMDRSVELMVGIHAVVAAGGQYVPVDPDAPVDRVRYMADAAGVGVVLVGAGRVPGWADELGSGFEFVVVDAGVDVDVSVALFSDADRLGSLGPDCALYTLFTSGSTGRPKGVTVSHRSVLNRLRWGIEEFGWSAADRVVLKTPFTFDVSVPELFATVMSGATTVVARPGGHADPLYLVDLIAESGATSVHFVPSMLSVFLDVVPEQRLASLGSLRWVMCSGEALPGAVVAQAHRVLPGASIVNLFGPTEAAVEVTAVDVTVRSSVPIGVPVWNTSAFVLDARLRCVPAGVAGELYLGGVQLARGYAGQSGLSAERFVASPFGGVGERLYRTGDLVRWTVGGEIEYLGRTDFQVKLRGQRIELGEIESAIASVPGVVHVACSVVDSPVGGQQLVGYVSPASVDLDVVRGAVGRVLPGYMVPSVWVLLDDISLNSAGKLDLPSCC